MHCIFAACLSRLVTGQKIFKKISQSSIFNTRGMCVERFQPYVLAGDCVDAPFPFATGCFAPLVGP